MQTDSALLTDASTSPLRAQRVQYLKTLARRLDAKTQLVDAAADPAGQLVRGEVGRDVMGQAARLAHQPVLMNRECSYVEKFLAGDLAVPVHSWLELPTAKGSS